MEGTLQKVVAIIVSIVIFFILPIYIAFEKKDDISYALALKITTDFVNDVDSKGYISSKMYNDFITNLAATQNSYDIYLEHISKKYNPVIYSYTDDLKTVRAKFDYNLHKDEFKSGQIVIDSGSNAGTYNNLVLAYDLSQRKYTQDQILSVIDSTNRQLTVNTTLDSYRSLDYGSLPAISSIYTISDDQTHNIYTMNVGDEFNVIVKNKNTTMATIIYNMITFGVGGQNNTKILVNYGGTIKAEKYRDKAVDDDTTNYNPETDRSNASSLVNSYITDGLMALYDGEYNIGTTHSNSSDSWSDLSGNGNNGALSSFNFDDNSGWRYNGLHFTGNEYIGTNLDLENEMTFEAVIRLDSVTDEDNTDESVLSNLNEGGAGIIFNTLNSEDVSSKGKVSFNVYGTDASGNEMVYKVTSDEVLQANKVYSISASVGTVSLDTDESGAAYNARVELLGINGNVKGEPFSATYKAPATGSTIIVGGNPLAGAGAIPKFKGTIYSVRIYNRALSEDEIKENFEVDKSKYNIN